MSDIGSSWNSVSSVVEFKFVSSAFAFVCFEISTYYFLKFQPIVGLKFQPIVGLKFQEVMR